MRQPDHAPERAKPERVKELHAQQGMKDAALLFAAAPTYEEYVAAGLVPARLLHARMAEIRVPPGDQLFFTTLPEPFYLIAVVAEDSPVTVAVLPIIARIARLSPLLDLRVLAEDEGIEFLSRATDDPELLAGLPDADLPLLVLFDRERQVAGQWGPQPQALDPYLDAWLNRHPDVDALAEDDTAAGQAAYAALLDELTQEMRLWFNSGLNRACVAEIRAMFPSVPDEAGQDAASNAPGAGDDEGDEDDETDD